jgi:hypothetical protein
VNVPINDRNALFAEDVLGGFGGNCYVVGEAEPTCACDAGVVAGRPAVDEGVRRAPLTDRASCLDD